MAVAAHAYENLLSTYYGTVAPGNPGVMALQ